MKLICNKCYVHELVIHDYNDKLYVDPCECLIPTIDEHINELEQSRDEGYDAGYGAGYEDCTWERDKKG